MDWKKFFGTHLAILFVGPCSMLLCAAISQLLPDDSPPAAIQLKDCVIPLIGSFITSFIASKHIMRDWRGNSIAGSVAIWVLSTVIIMISTGICWVIARNFLNTNGSAWWIALWGILALVFFFILLVLVFSFGIWLRKLFVPEEKITVITFKMKR